MHVAYRVYLDDSDTVTEKISLTANPDFNHKKVFNFAPATRQVSSTKAFESRFF